ncbi:MAG TPA: energy transducer TonB [Flavobacteriales bacterium]|nr:energy transducer TonB [Flavobacteriales bacterium]
MAEQLAVKPFDEIVFEHRNKEYGAYELRKRYDRNMNTAFIIAISVFVISVSIPAIMDFLEKIAPKEAPVNVELNLADAPPLDKDEPPPPPPPPDPPPPVQETIKFTPPVVTEEPIDEKDIPPPQDEIKVQTGTDTKEGTGTFELPDEGDGNDDFDEQQQQIFTIVETMPEFPGGEEKLFEYLGKNIKYPAMARENGITGTVYVTFVVEGSGEISDVKKLRGIGGGCDEEAIRVVRSMPSWKPGKQNGKTVRVQYNLPIKFTLR